MEPIYFIFFIPCVHFFFIKVENNISRRKNNEIQDYSSYFTTLIIHYSDFSFNNGELIIFVLKSNVLHASYKSVIVYDKKN